MYLTIWKLEWIEFFKNKKIKNYQSNAFLHIYIIIKKLCISLGKFSGTSNYQGIPWVEY